MKTVLFLLTFWAMNLLFACNSSTSQTASKSSITLLSPAEFQKQIETLPNEQLIDLRTADEISATGKIANAQAIDFYEQESFVQQVGQLDKQRPIMVYCARGGRSGDASQQLKDMGFTHIIDLEGGMGAWQEAQLPTTK